MNRFFTLLAGIAIAFTPAFAIDEALKVGKDLEIQKAKELEETEKSLNQKIKVFGEDLNRYGKLINVDVKRTPAQTEFSKDKEYIALLAYSFIPKSYNDGTPVGYRYKKVKLFFSGNKLNKIETDIFEENFHEKTITEIRVTDPTPMDENPDDIIVSTTVNKGKPYEVTLKNMENTLTNPNRIKFKRDYYLPHLDQFERMFRYTEEYQKRYGTNNDVVTIDHLRKSLVY